MTRIARYASAHSSLTVAFALGFVLGVAAALEDPDTARAGAQAFVTREELTCPAP